MVPDPYPPLTSLENAHGVFSFPSLNGDDAILSLRAPEGGVAISFLLTCYEVLLQLGRILFIANSTNEVYPQTVVWYRKDTFIMTKNDLMEFKRRVTS